MALLLPCPLPSLSFTSSSTSRIPGVSCFRFSHNAIALHQKPLAGGRVQAPFVPIVKASSDVIKEKITPVEQSKIQELDQQRLKMKLAKKIRLRRKRLVRKRHLRNKGRWPPSKLNKNKNVET